MRSLSTAAAAAPKKAAAPKAPKKASALPSYKDLIKECIANAGGRDGVSRPTIKKFLEDHYKSVQASSLAKGVGEH